MEFFMGLGIGLLAALGGYVLGAAACGLLILRHSSNRHDRKQEAAMTAIFVAGPVTGLLAGIGAAATYWLN